MHILPGVLLALSLAVAASLLADFIGIRMMGLPASPVSSIMMAIILGILVRNAFSLPAAFHPGIRLGLVQILRFGIVLLGFRLSWGEIGQIGLHSLPIIGGSLVAALFIVTRISRSLGLSGRFGTLIAVGTSICGATAIVATAPGIGARQEEVSYSIACVTLFGVAAMLMYPYLAYHLFSGDALAAGLFLGTAVHETAQVAGAGMVYQQYYNSPQALDVATVTKLVRNLSMLLIIPLMSILYHRESGGRGELEPRWWRLIPLFVVGFLCTSLSRTLGDYFLLATPNSQIWGAVLTSAAWAAELCLSVAMASVGLGTNIRDLRTTGIKPLIVGLLSAVLVGCVSIVLVGIFY